MVGTRGYTMVAYSDIEKVARMVGKSEERKVGVMGLAKA